MNTSYHVLQTNHCIHLSMWAFAEFQGAALPLYCAQDNDRPGAAVHVYYNTWFVQIHGMIISMSAKFHKSIHTKTFHFFINFVNVELVYRVNCQ